MRAWLDGKAEWFAPSLLLSLTLLGLSIGLAPVTGAAHRWSESFLPAGLIAGATLGGGWVLFETYRCWRENGAGPRSCWAGRIDRGRIAAFFLGAVLATFCVESYGGVKTQVALLVPFTADPMLADLDKAIMLGTDAWQRLDWARHDLLFALYHKGWVVWLLVTMAALLIRAPSRHRDSLITLFFALWVAGPLVHLVLPAAGPLLYDNIGLGDRFAAMPVPLESVTVESYLWAGFVERRSILAGGISAMPSLHMATAAWAVLAFRRTPMFWPAIAIWLYLFAGSVLTGWHYAIDGFAGAAMALACYWLVRRFLFPDLESSVRRSPATVPQPAGLAGA